MRHRRHYSNANAVFMLIAWLLVVTAAGTASALTMPDEPFARSVKAPRMYVTKLYVPANTPTVLRTLDSAPGVDPMLFVTYGRGTLVASDDVLGVNPRVVLDFPTGRWVRVIVASFDAAYAGQTTFRVRMGASPATDIPVWAGGAAIQTGWKEGDIISSTSSYWGEPVKEVCEKMDDLPLTPYQSATWNADTLECDLLHWNETLHWSAEEVCHAVDMGYRAVNVHSDRCEYASDAKDTIVLAIEHWEKLDTKCWYIPGPDINTPGWWLCDEVPVPPLLEGLNDDSGAGRNFRMTMDEDSIGGVTSSPVLMVGLYPYVTDLAPHDGVIEDAEDGPCTAIRKDLEERGFTNSFPWWFVIGGQYRICPASTSVELGVTRDWIRVYRDNYRDRQTGDWDDPDYDGLSSALEYKLGTDKNLVDSDYDGIMDGLEIYGPIWDVRDWVPDSTSPRYTLRSYLPLPYYGADPLQKNVVVEVDRQETTSVSAAGRSLAARTTYSALAEAGIHTIVIDDGPNERTVIPDDTQVGDGQTFNDTGLPADLRDFAGDYFDLIDYPFARHFAWTRTCVTSSGSCGGASSTVVDTFVDNRRLLAPVGRYICARQSVSFLHELGHLLGFGHAGSGWNYRNQNPISIPDPASPGDTIKLKSEYNTQPNYWAVMSYGATLPIHESADGVVYDADLHLGRPNTHFSREKMIDLDEAALWEWDGLVGHTAWNLPIEYQFDGGNYHGLRVDWVDWDKGGDNDSTAQVNLTLEGDDCYFNEDDYSPPQYVNPVTGAHSEVFSDVCPDYLEGNNDIDYLQSVDMSWFTRTLARGGAQYSMATGMTPTDDHWPIVCPYTSGIASWWCDPELTITVVEEACP